MGFIVGLVVAIQIPPSGCGGSPTEAESLKQKQAAAKKVKDERKRFEDSAQLARADPQYTGMWMMGEYVDEFKEKTGKRYFTNTERIKGTFSNSATEDSKLDVELLVDLKNVSIKLYEYGRSLKKSSSSDKFSINIQDKDGGRHRFLGTIFVDQMFLDDRQIADFHAIMKKGDPIKFLIRNDSRFVESYFFTIPEPDGYENALRILTEKK